MRVPKLSAVFAAAFLAAWATLAADPAGPSSTILVFENLTVADAPAVLASSDRLVWDRLTGRAVAQASAGTVSRLERIPHSLLQGPLGEDFVAALRAELPGYAAGARGESRYAVKEPVNLIKPQGAPRQRPEARRDRAESACLSEDFEVTPIWYEDGGPWWHYEGGQPYNDVGNYFWLDDNCDSFSGSWEADAIMGGTIGQTLPCGATYDYNTNSWMEYAPWITCLSGAPYATLTFFTRLETEQGYDLFYYVASVDGTNYSGYTLSGNYADTWYAVTQDMRSWYGLGDLTSYPQIALAFVFQSDNQINQGFGVRVDDIALTASACPAITLSPASLPSGTVGTAYSQTLTAGGGAAPYTYANTSGLLPAGLSLTSGGHISGTPTAAGTSSFTVTVTDATGCTGSQAYSVTINSVPCPTITLSPTLLPSGMVGTAYYLALNASGGTAPYIYAKTAGTRPPGVSLTSGGLLSGTPTTAGTFNFTVTATDAHGCTGNQAYSIMINSAPCPTIMLSPTILPGGTVGTGYSQAITASGGTAPYTFAKTAGTHPPGVSLSSAGLLSGTPTTAGPFSFTVTATDAHGCKGSQVYSITVNNANCPTITLSPTILPNGTVGTGYYLALNASGGTAPYTYAKTAGTHPPGVSVSSGGLLSGTPTAAGTFNFTVTATDAHSCTGSQNYTMTITAVPPPVIFNMVKMDNPFRIVANGSNLQGTIKIYITANRWKRVSWKSTTKVVIKGGTALKAAVPQGTPTDFTFVNPDGGAATVTGWSW